MSEQEPAAQLLEEMNAWSAAFDKLCNERHQAGAAEYGKFTFLENDVVRMMAEELADTSNYCRMQFIKLMFLQRLLEGELASKGVGSDTDGNITMGVQAFKGVGEVGWN